jgi:hypothetical protein
VLASIGATGCFIARYCQIGSNHRGRTITQ